MNEQQAIEVEKQGVFRRGAGGWKVENINGSYMATKDHSTY